MGHVLDLLIDCCKPDDHPVMCIVQSSEVDSAASPENLHGMADLCGEHSYRSSGHEKRLFSRVLVK